LDVRKGFLIKGGNGKYLPVNNGNIFTFGTDRSENLLDICKQRDKSF
jgi:hypothetical protein